MLSKYLMTIGEISIKRVLSSSIDIYKTSFRSKSKVKAEQLTKRKMEIYFCMPIVHFLITLTATDIV